jgi:hypothetical protein
VPRYFLDLPGSVAPVRWNPHAGPRPERADTRYFGAVFATMEETLRDRQIDVYLTWDVQRLPSYGERVVAVVLGDEVGRIPRYAGQVRAIFKSYGTHPMLGAGSLKNPGHLGASDLVQYAVRWLRWLPGGAAQARRTLRERLRREPAIAPISVIPLGTFNQLELPVVPIEQRTVDVFFAGSIEHGNTLRDRVSPKRRSRREMLAAVRRLALSRPDLQLDIRATSGFDASAAGSPGAYSRALMDSRVCLAPRGTSIETFRVFEGLRAGCVVVTERLPRHWFYDGAPVIQIERWSGLEEMLVLDEPAELRELHARALAWWRDRCSEAALGRFMAERLNSLESVK